MSNILKFREKEIVSVVHADVEMVAIKPICEALELDYKTQFDKVKEDEMLGQLWGLSHFIAKDGKEREMVCLPVEFVFGWLFSIGGQANETFRAYKRECYHTLYMHFVGRAQFELKKSLEAQALRDQLANLKNENKQAEADLAARIREVEARDFDRYMRENRQLKLAI